MNNLRVEGFNDIVFWQESGIGVIVIKTSQDSKARPELFEELIVALTTAATDDNVKAVAITGMNRNFLKEVVGDNGSSEFRERMFRFTSAYLSTVYSLEKNVYALVGGDSTDIGMEIALSADLILTSEGVSLGFNQGWKFCCGGSLTALRFPLLSASKALSGRNCDIVLPSATFLDASREFILKDLGFPRHLMRRRRMENLRISLLEEKEEFLKTR